MMLTDPLPDPLPAEPLAIAAAWLEDAWRRRDQPNPNAMVLATSTPGGLPAARVVLCKSIEAGPGCVRFVSNYQSRKGRELAAKPRAALVLHWDHTHRQVRLEGIVTQATEADSDSYFATRARLSQLGAHASAQSEPIASREALDAKLDAAIGRYGAAAEGGAVIPRPAHWGGYVFWVETAELWVEGHGRLHDRARFSRRLVPAGAGLYAGGAWTATRLQP
jgi:pyridoxamine 5'-phosphate oxidase